jgi:hypothetical protein
MNDFFKPLCHKELKNRDRGDGMKRKEERKEVGKEKIK